MIYLIIDTCTWLYLANGFDTMSGKIDITTYRHIQVFEQIKLKVNTKEFIVLVNDIILLEWKRNKKVAENQIQTINLEKKKEISRLVALKSDMDSIEFKNLCYETNKFFNSKIEIAEKHIEDVEFFLNSCQKYEISDEIKLEIANLAIEKERAPFITSKNNVADAAILYGGIDFLKSNQKEHLEKAVFASANYKDFGISKTSNAFHPDIKSRLEGIHLEFHQNWKDLLGLTEDLQYEIDSFHDYIRENLQYFTCLSPFCEHDDYQGFGYLDNKYRYTKYKLIVDPNQLELFERKEPIYNDTIHLNSMGHCVRCENIHIVCPDCDSLLIDINDSDQFYCDFCEESFEMGKCPVNGDKIIYQIDEEEIHL